jgi:hypothetical protein
MENIIRPKLRPFSNIVLRGADMKKKLLASFISPIPPNVPDHGVCPSP